MGFMECRSTRCEVEKTYLRAAYANGMRVIKENVARFCYMHICNGYHKFCGSDMLFHRTQIHSNKHFLCMQCSVDYGRGFHRTVG